MSIAEYEACTPRELGMGIDVYNQKREAESEDLVTLVRAAAYMIGANTSRWVWAKQIPSFEEYMAVKKKDEAMSDTAMFAAVKALNARMGGIVIEDKEGGEDDSS